jgi:hypothetical protein
METKRKKKKTTPKKKKKKKTKTKTKTKTRKRSADRLRRRTHGSYASPPPGRPGRLAAGSGDALKEHADRRSLGSLVADAARGVARVFFDRDPLPADETDGDRGTPCYLDVMAREGDVSRADVDGRPGKRDGGKDGKLVRAVRRAVEQFRTLSGLDADSLSGLRPENDGWSLLIDVVELERIPLTLSVMATYRVDMDPDGHLVSYERLRRFTRDATD